MGEGERLRREGGIGRRERWRERTRNGEERRRKWN